MNNLIVNKQKEDYKQLFNKDIPELLKNNKTVIGDLEITLHPDISEQEEENGTLFQMFRASCNIKNIKTKESLNFYLDLLKIPVLTHRGFKVNNNYKQVLDLYNKVTGWVLNGKEVIEDIIENDTTIMKKNNAALVIPGRSSIKMEYSTQNKCYISFKHGSLPIAEFFKALTSYTTEDLLEKFGFGNVFIADNLENNTDKKTCVDKLYNAIRETNKIDSNFSVNDKLQIINRYLFNKHYLNVGREYSNRLEKTLSFQHRAIGKTLAEDVVVQGKVLYETGKVLDAESLRILDNSLVDYIKVEYNSKIFRLNKFSIFSFRALNYRLAEDTLDIKAKTVLDFKLLEKLNSSDLEQITILNERGNKFIIKRRVAVRNLEIDDFLSIFDIYASNLNGFDTYDDAYELNNRIVVPFKHKVLSCLEYNIDEFIKNLEKELDSSNLYSCMSTKIKVKDENLNAIITTMMNTEEVESQQADMTNSIHYASKSYKAVTDIDNKSATEDLQKVQNLQCGRIDSIDSPESNKIGLVGQRCMFTKETEAGYLTAPFIKVENGVELDEVVDLTAQEEKDQYIAEFNETFLDKDGNKKNKVRARYNGNIVTVDTDKVRYKEYSQLQNMSLARACIPLQEHSNAKRLLMGCGHQKQAIPVLGSSRPFVCTGVESIFDSGIFTARSVLEDFYNENKAILPEIEKYKDIILNSSISIEQVKDKDMTRTVILVLNDVKTLVDNESLNISYKTTISFPFFQRTPENTIFSFKIIPKRNNIYKENDIIACDIAYDTNDSDIIKLGNYGRFTPDENVFKKGYGIGVNLNVAYKTFKSTTIDDSITISDRLISDDTLTSISIIKLKVELHNTSERREDFGKPSNSKSLSRLDNDGLIKIGSVLRQNDEYACVIIKTKDSKSLDSTKENIKKYTFDEDYEGQVFSKTIKQKDGVTYAEILVACRNCIEVGDKLTGQHGNKGVVANIIPESQMPYDPVTGTTVDICLNPLGIPSRMNISQLIIVILSMGMKQKGKRIVIPPFTEGVVDYVKDLAESHDIKPMHLIDGRTGLYFKRPINVGVIYMYKLIHTAKKKINAVGLSKKTDRVFLQALKGQKNQGGQSIGEMEAWCLEGMQTNKLLQSIYSLQSDDVHGKEDAIEEILSDQKEFNSFGENNNAATLLAFTRSMCIDIKLEDDSYIFTAMKDDDIRRLSPKPVMYKKDLHSLSVFGPSNNPKSIAAFRDAWSYINLNTSIINPLWMKKGDLASYIAVIKKELNDKEDSSETLSIAPASIFARLLNQTAYIDWSASGYPNYYTIKNNNEISKLPTDTITGNDAILELFSNYDITKTLAVYDEMLEKKNFSDLDLAKKRNQLVDFIDSGETLSSFIISSWPVMPQTFRQEIKDIKNRTSDFDKWYHAILNNAAALKQNHSNINVENLYKTISGLIGISSLFKEQKDSDRVSLISYFTGSGSKTKAKNHGKIRTHVLSKRVFCSGRAVIVPASIPLRATEIGVPISMIVKMYLEFLIPKLTNVIGLKESNKKSQTMHENWKQLLNAIGSQNKSAFKKVYDIHFKDYTEPKLDASTAYSIIIEYIINYIEKNAVVLSGRQPSLHQFSARAFRVKVVFTNAIQVHPLVCSGYNADFDGDQMYTIAILQEEAKKEALEKASPASVFVNGKDGSAVLMPAQDIALGLYCATMLRDNVASIYEKPECLDDIRFYSDANLLREDLDNNVIEYHTLVIFNYKGRLYYSTAGRILFNSLLPDCFTNEPFSNPLTLPKIKLGKVEYGFDNIRDLRYDGLISTKSGYRDEIKYIKLGEICEYIYTYYKHEAIDYYQKIVDFGFHASDIFGITLALDDIGISMKPTEIKEHHTEQTLAIMDAFDKGLINEKNKNEKLKIIDTLYQSALSGVTTDSDKDIKEVLFAETNSKIDKLEEYYQLGLVSEEDKKSGIAKIYNKTHTKIKNSLQNSMKRNNNLFIIFDSGARGSVGQIMQSSASIGILQKSRLEDMETPIANNYYNGLSSFDLHLTTFSTRMGVLSTQKETPNAGYATRTSIYMQQGIHIVENDCGKENWWVDIKYGARKDKVLLEPSFNYFKENLLGKKVSKYFTLFDGTLDENGCITEASFSRIADGFEVIQLEDQVIDIKISSIIGAELSERDERANRYLKNFLVDGHLSYKCIDTIERKHLKSIETDKGTFRFFYELDSLMESLLIGREGSETEMNGLSGLPHLEEIVNPNSGKIMNLITKETLKYVEENSIERIPARILLDCKSVGGVCAHCYGKRVSTMKIPEVGDNIGVETAQAMGEPSAQLTMSLINQGGASGASIAGGVDIFRQLLSGEAVGGAKAQKAILAPISGYAEVHKLDSKAIIIIKPESEDSELCERCKTENSCNNCPLNTKSYNLALCSIKEKLNFNDILITNGDYIEIDETLSSGTVSPNDIEFRTEESLRKKEMIQLGLYYNTFKSNGIFIKAVNFELLARLQASVVTITDPGITDLKIGTEMEYSELLKKVSKEELKTIGLTSKIQKKQQVVQRYSGPLAVATFEDVTTNLANFVTRAVKSDRISALGAAVIGLDMRKQSELIEPPKSLNQISEDRIFVDEDEIEEYDNFQYFEQKQQKDQNSVISFDLENFDLDDLNLFNDVEISEETTQEDLEVQEETLEIEETILEQEDEVGNNKEKDINLDLIDIF